MFLSLVLEDYRILLSAQLLLMIVIAGRLSILGFCIQTSLLASRRQHTSTDLQSKNTVG